MLHGWELGRSGPGGVGPWSTDHCLSHDKVVYRQEKDPISTTIGGLFILEQEGHPLPLKSDPFVTKSPKAKLAGGRALVGSMYLGRANRLTRAPLAFSGEINVRYDE